MAEHQITIGDDKVFYQVGSKPSTGSSTPGVRNATYVGTPPIVVPGRSGDQYAEYISQNIAEMYQIADIAELDKEINGQLDPYTMLFRSIRQKQKFSFYAEKFEQFLVKVHETALNLFKRYATEHIFIPVVGKNERVNMQDFKNSSDIVWEVKIEPMTDDLETKMGKQLTLNHILQYIGPQLDKKDIGKFLRLSPYLNTEKMFQDLTSDYDNAVNDVLALDRGQYPPTQQYEDHDYAVKYLVNRMKQPDFRYLPPQIQQMYEKKKQEHEAAIAIQLQKVKQAESEFIPSGGYLTVCDLYVPAPGNPGKTQRVKIPSEALAWLLKQLETQGTTQQMIQDIGNQQVSADIAGLFTQGQQNLMQ